MKAILLKHTVENIGEFFLTLVGKIYYKIKTLIEIESRTPDTQITRQTTPDTSECRLT